MLKSMRSTIHVTMSGLFLIREVGNDVDYV